jgi:hypothetical protein
MGAFQYQRMWISVPALNGGLVMGSSSAPKLLNATITELKPKSVAKTIPRIKKRKKLRLLKLN